MELQKGKKRRSLNPRTRGCSSAGRAPALHAGGQEFEPPHLHQGEERKDGQPMNLIGMGA